MSLGQKVTGSAKHLVEAVVPTTLFSPGLPRRSPTKMQVATVPLSGPDRERLANAKGPIEVVLPQALALTRRIELPSAAASRSEAAIGLQLRQTLPGHAQGLVWRSIVQRRSRDTIEYAVYMLKQSVLDNLLTDLRHLGSRIERVSLDIPSLPAFWERRPANAQATKNWIGFSMLTTVLAGVLGIVGLASDRSALLDLVTSRAQQVSELEKRRDALTTDAGEGQKAATAALNDMAVFAAQSRRLQLLSDLTEVLPDSVWVSELSISGDRLVFSGFTSEEVTAVINVLQNLPWAKEVQLNGAISFDSYSGQSRFEIGLLIAPSSPT